MHGAIGARLAEAVRDGTVALALGLVAVAALVARVSLTVYVNALLLLTSLLLGGVVYGLGLAASAGDRALLRRLRRPLLAWALVLLGGVLGWLV